MNIADAVLAVSVVLLFLVILGTMRETVLLRGHVTALAQLITKPPLPNYLGGRLAPALDRQLKLGVDSGAVHVLLFVREGCDGCDGIVKDVARAIGNGSLPRERLICVVSAASKQSPIFQASRTISEDSILDSTGELFRASEIRGTPTQLALWSDSREVFDYKIGGDVGWILQKLQQEPSRVTLAGT